MDRNHIYICNIIYQHYQLCIKGGSNRRIYSKIFDKKSTFLIIYVYCTYILVSYISKKSTNYFTCRRRFQYMRGSLTKLYEAVLENLNFEIWSQFKYPTFLNI